MEPGGKPHLWLFGKGSYRPAHHHTHPPDRLEEEPAILQRLRRGERVDHYHTVRMRKDGTFVDISLTISPVRNAAGEIVGASKIARDITQHKRAEEALRLSNERFRLMADAASVLIRSSFH
jgi:PAS domain-containing protein